MRKKIVAGNWKMNLHWNEARSLVEKLNEAVVDLPDEVGVAIAPPTPYLAALAEMVSDQIRVAAQNCSQHEKGAYTGEQSAGMLSSIHVNRCLVGHSERRLHFGDSNEIVGEKVAACIKAGIAPVLCCGESLEDRKAEKHFDTVRTQVEAGLSQIDSKSVASMIVAYEPVWAIGTGETASTDQAQEMHAFIRDLISEKADQMTAEMVPILYGGSVKPNNAEELFNCSDVDGGLVGGASLKAEDFIAIIKAAY